VTHYSHKLSLQIITLQHCNDINSIKHTMAEVTQKGHKLNNDDNNKVNFCQVL